MAETAQDDFESAQETECIDDVVVPEVGETEDPARQSTLTAGDAYTELRQEPTHDGRCLETRRAGREPSGRPRGLVGATRGTARARAAARVISASAAALATSASTPPRAARASSAARSATTWAMGGVNAVLPSAWPARSLRRSK